MPLLERRLQILLQQEQYDRIEAEARRTGQSVAAVIREAIDARLDADQARRADAARWLLAHADDDTVPGEHWTDLKAQMESELIAILPDV